MLPTMRRSMLMKLTIDVTTGIGEVPVVSEEPMRAVDLMMSRALAFLQTKAGWRSLDCVSAEKDMSSGLPCSRCCWSLACETFLLSILCGGGGEAVHSCAFCGCMLLYLQSAGAAQLVQAR